MSVWLDGYVVASTRYVVCRAYIYIIYTPNLGFEIAVSGREREQGRFRGSIEGARESTREHEGSSG